MSTNVKVVNLEGEIVLSRLETLRSAILEALGERKKVMLSLARAEEIDLFGAQMLYAARRHADRIGRELHITGEVPERIARRLYESGFAERVARQGRELELALHEFGSAAESETDEGAAPEEPSDA